MPAPKSPLDKPSSHSRRPGNTRRSSSDKSTSQSTSSTSKHGVKGSHSAVAKVKAAMPDPSLGAKAPSRQGNEDEGEQHNNRKDLRERVRSQSSTHLAGQISSEVNVNRYQEAEEADGAPMERNKEQTAPNSLAEEVERLRAALNAQLQLNQHRDKLAKSFGEKESQGGTAASFTTPGGKTRVSPIHEETVSKCLDAAFASPLASSPWTASTESARTVRDNLNTPATVTARTPSYPFPPMRTPGSNSSGHQPFTALSPTVNPSNYAGGSFDGTGKPHDQVLSGSVTPSSTFNFQPSGAYASRHDPNFETPNLYEISLMLAAEPGLDPWWTTVVQLMRDIYKADRITLSIPADSTDIENVPWGQKATFNAIVEDELSLTYLPGASSLVPSSIGTNETSNSEDNTAESPTMTLPLLTVDRPELHSRHSFTAYEDTKREPRAVQENSRTASTRPPPLTRAKSYLSGRPDLPPRTGTLQNAQLSLRSLQDHMNYEDKKPSVDWENADTAHRNVQGSVFPVLQALDYEAEPLIDSSGVLRVLERGKVVALTRDYPYLDDPEDEKSGGSKSSQHNRKSKDPPLVEKSTKAKAPELGSRISSFLGSKSSRHSSRSVRSQGSEKGRSMPVVTRAVNDGLAPELLRYEEYEQAPPSPWTQSPAPSPAVRTETGENPFFATAPVDEGTFNPNTTPQDYAQTQPLETIGVDRSWTVLHIPLTHPLLSKSVQSFRLDAAAIESKSAGRGRAVAKLAKYADTSKPHVGEQVGEKRTPIAILSILSPVIPYPSVLRHSLEHLAPHLATSFSLCRHFSNLETEIAGLSRKRPPTAGFGAVAPGPRMAGERVHLANFPSSPEDEGVTHRSLVGSMTSPSDYSGVSRSTAGSPGGTPGWDPGSVGLSMDKRSNGGSPAYSTGESYFSSRSRPGLGRVDTGTSSNITGARNTSKDMSQVESKFPHFSRKAEEGLVDFEYPEQREGLRKTKVEQEKQSATPTQPDARIPGDRSSRDLQVETSELRDSSPFRLQHELTLSPRRQALRTASNQGAGKAERQHTQLHSYGADFGSTFQYLPTTSTSTSRAPTTAQPRSHSASLSLPTDMPPPSDRLKGLMLDSLPAHVFVALPPTGEIVWVNNRYLTYRGQTVPELYEDPWGSIHPDEREDYLKAWAYAIKTGEQFSMQVRIRRFDGTYRWFYTRAVGSRDVRGVIVQWYGSHMDIHDQHIAEVKAARQEEIQASEAKHRQLANLIPQIIFAATEDEGVTFANEQWLSYTGQDFNDALGLGFMDYVHPEDLAKCHIPTDQPPTPSQPRPKKPHGAGRKPSQMSSAGKSAVSEAPTENTVKGVYQSLSRNNSSSTSSIYELQTGDLSELARAGIIKVSTDSDGRLSYTTEARLRSKTGEYRWHLVRCVEVDNINLGSGDGSWFGACTDINDHKLLETKLKEAMESKGKFLSNMSHEIRTPLIGISGMVNFLQDTVLNDEQIDYTNTISSSATSLLNIINDILDLSKVDAGMMKLSYEWLHIRSLVEEVNEMVSTLAITKRLELNYVVDVDVPEMVKGDKFRIRQVLLNVIGNAIKFTTVGEVFTRCRVASDKTGILGKDQIMIEFSVVDTGRGFTKEEADLMFKPFSQIDGSSTRQHGGSGLGLVISRQLVELHGGKMEGTAVPNKGSTFKFSAIFGVPTAEDYPEPIMTPTLSKIPSERSSITSIVSNEATARAMKLARGNPILANTMMQSPAVDSPRTESSIDSPVFMSSGSSNLSIHSAPSRTRSSSSSTAQSLAHFGEAARSGTDLSQMKLALPPKASPPASPTSLPSPSRRAGILSHETTLTVVSNPASKDDLSSQAADTSELKHVRPPMYSILLICPQTHSREATTQHIEITLPKDVPHKITPLSNIAEAQDMIGGIDPVIFTHIVLNLPSADEIITLIEQIMLSTSLPHTSIVVLSDPVQRQEVIKLASGYDYDQLAKDNRVRFVYKPVKPSRFAVIFDPDKERNLSTDRNRSSAQQQVANQKQNYLDVGKRLGNKGLKVLLVEDNLVNQKVLLKFLGKVGIAVELALDGVECTDKVFSHPHSFYSLILVSHTLHIFSSVLILSQCDLHMPRKDGYQTCQEIREWEQKEKLPRMPIIALSANVMADVLDRCVQAGFNSYVTKPVDFKALSTAMGNLLDPTDGQVPSTLIKG
jgi:signal transduction histidine kinase/CheY-like chemotaxis protein